MRSEAERLSDKHPEEADEIRKKFEQMENVWNELRKMLRQREDSLGAAGNLQKFLKDLDRFQVILLIPLQRRKHFFFISVTYLFYIYRLGYLQRKPQLHQKICPSLYQKQKNSSNNIKPLN